ncbi:unnamed protein product [Rhizopus stolonifer]
MHLQKQLSYLNAVIVQNLKVQELTTMQQSVINVSNPQAAVDALKKAIEFDQAGGNFRSAAKHWQDIAELFESELNEPKEAFGAYKEASDMYTADDSPALANKCLLKVAQIAAELEIYSLAIEKYEMVASAAVDDPLLKWSLKDYLFKAGLCHLCTEVSFYNSDVILMCVCVCYRIWSSQVKRYPVIVIWTFHLNQHGNMFC